MYFTSVIALSILAFTATTASAYSYNYDSLVARSPYEVEPLYERDASAYPNAYADANAYPHAFARGGHTKPDSKPDAKPSTSTKPPSSRVLKKATNFLKKLQAGTLKVADSDLGKLLGVACDLNTIASIFDSNSSIGSDVSNGVTLACTAGQIAQVAAGAKHKRWEEYKRAAAAEADALAAADAFEEHEMMLVARWAAGLDY
ncbi:hypothetical protein MMC18_004802 [Xylographa bjoerkii]|nr:hypothetical protein [Xylographa bjoerkii]